MIGRKISFFRTQKNLTQEELCSGICSTSYLSKIENNKTIPSVEVLELLCKRLEIRLEDISEEDEEAFGGKLDQWFKILIKQQIDEAEKQFKDIQIHVINIENPQLLLKYDMLQSLHVFVMKENQTDFSNILKNFTKLKQTFNNELNFLYYYINGMKNESESRLEEASSSLEKSLDYLKLLIDKEDIKAHLYYRLALVYSKMHKTFFAFENANKSLEIVSKQFEYDLSLKILILLAINKARVSQFTEAIFTYKKALNVAEKSHNNKIIGIIYHNIGYLQMKLNKHDQAIQFFKKSLLYLSEDDYDKLVKTYFCLAKEYLFLGKTDEVDIFINKGFEISQKYGLKDYIFHFKILDFKRKNSLHEYLDFLKIEVIPFFTESSSWNYVAEYSELMSNQLFQQLKYKEGSKFLGFANEARKKMT